MHMASHHHHLPHRQHYPRIKRESRRFVVPLLGLGNLLFLLCCCKLLSVAPFHHPKRYFHYCPSSRELRGGVVRLARLAYLLMLLARRARATLLCDPHTRRIASKQHTVLSWNIRTCASHYPHSHSSLSLFSGNHPPGYSAYALSDVLFVFRP
jgi:hypothetical protein